MLIDDAEEGSFDDDELICNVIGSFVAAADLMSDEIISSSLVDKCDASLAGPSFYSNLWKNIFSRILN
jgi:hypothetical protein